MNTIIFAIIFLTIFILIVWLVLIILRIKSLKFFLLIVLLTITFIDTIRKLVGGQIFLLTAIDFSLLLLFFAFYTSSFLRGRLRFGILREIEPLLKISLWLYIGIVLIQALNPNVPNWLVRLAGLRSYLLAIPMMGIGWYIAKNWKIIDYEKAGKVLLFLISLTVIFGVYGFLIRLFKFQAPLYSITLPLEGGHLIHSFGFMNVELIPSFFASAKRWARYLVFLYPFAWACLIVAGRYKIAFILSILTFIGIFISGSREGLIMFLFFQVAQYMITKSYQFIADLKRIMFFFFRATQYMITKPYKFIPCVTAILWALFLITLVNPYLYLVDKAKEKAKEKLQYRIQFSLSTPEDWIFRFNYMFFQPLVIITEGRPEVFTGLGIGSYGQETKLLKKKLYFPWIPEVARDAGLVKIIVELGIFGLLAFLMLQFSILSYLRYLPKAKNDPLFIASSLVIIIWLILFLKAHTVLSDLMLNIFYWYYFGILVYRVQLFKKHTFKERCT